MKEISSESLPTNNLFGAFFSIVFLVAAVFAFLLEESVQVGYIFLTFAVLTTAVTVVAPSALHPFNKLWFGLGISLGKVINPVVIGIIFVFLITPTSLITRLFGRDELKLRRRGGGGKMTYWVDRKPSGPAPQSFKNQF